MAAIQKARNGRSVSSELPFTTKAGTATNSSAAQSGCGEKRRARDHMAAGGDQRKHHVGGVKRNLSHAAEHGDQTGQHPPIQRRMRLAAQVHFLALKHVAGVVGVQRIDERVGGLGEINVIVALNGLVEKGNPDQQHQPQHQQELPGGYAGFHRSTGLRAAVTSSTRLVRVP